MASCSSADFWGDVDLGNAFYYMTEPTYNCINLSESPDNPMKTSSFVIRDIEFVGFNDNYILAINKTKDTLRYWIIDKTQPTIRQGYRDSSNLLLTNVKQSLDSFEFIRIKTETNIQLLSKKDYQKKYNWDKSNTSD